jgi:hypothetical protein
MNSETFTYWLQGFIELSDTDTISEKQWLIIKDHLKLVFDKKTPDRTEFNPVRMPTTIDYTKVSDLIGKQVDPSYWKYPYQPVITC